MPKLDDLINEIEEIQKKNPKMLEIEKGIVKNVAKETKLKSYIEIFENFLDNYEKC